MERQARVAVLVALPVVAPVVAALAVGAWNFFTLQGPLDQALESDSRNTGIEARAHYQNYLNPSVIVFDLRAVAGDKSQADIFRALLQFASEMKDREFEAVELAYRGTTKFILAGRYFQQLGREYGTQNPVYTMRTFPQNLLRPDGEKAFPTWEGGLLGVTGKQIEDFGEFHKQWYLADLVEGS